jgi:hypothetical protein
LTTVGVEDEEEVEAVEKGQDHGPDPSDLWWGLKKETQKETCEREEDKDP